MWFQLFHFWNVLHPSHSGITEWAWHFTGSILSTPCHRRKTRSSYAPCHRVTISCGIAHAISIFFLSWRSVFPPWSLACRIFLILLPCDNKWKVISMLPTRALRTLYCDRCASCTTETWLTAAILDDCAYLIKQVWATFRMWEFRKIADGSFHKY